MGALAFVLACICSPLARHFRRPPLRAPGGAAALDTLAGAGKSCRRAKLNSEASPGAAGRCFKLDFNLQPVGRDGRSWPPEAPSFAPLSPTPIISPPGHRGVGAAGLRLANALALVKHNRRQGARTATSGKRADGRESAPPASRAAAYTNALDASKWADEGRGYGEPLACFETRNKHLNAPTSFGGPSSENTIGLHSSDKLARARPTWGGRTRTCLPRPSDGTQTS